MNKENLHVAVGVVRNKNGDVLLGQRLPGKHLAGYWEFPGGKVEAGETVQQALARELNEELGITVHSSEPLIVVKHDYPERSVVLDTWVVNDFSGEVANVGPEGQALRWVPENELNSWKLPPADKPIVNAIRLPGECLITPSNLSADELLAGVTKALQRGMKLIQLRGVAIEQPEKERLVRQLIERCADVTLVANVGSSLQLEAAQRLGFDGVHLKSSLLQQLTERPVADSFWLGCSAHNGAELEKAIDLRADFALLSPVAATQSHPQTPPLGWQAAADLAANANVPIFALGGMQPENLDKARELGFQGIAAISGLWPTPS